MSDARRLVVRGFFNEIVLEIGNEEVQNRIMDRIDNELEKAANNG
jgi:Fe-S cluster assembly protein SufD